jgi:arylformamidase
LGYCSCTVARLIDVSLPVGPDLLTWPGDPGIEVQPAKRIARGDPSNVSELRIGTHTGTHVDPPVHFVEGADPIDRVPLDVLFGDAVVADLTGAGAIGPSELEELDLRDGTERLLCKTKNSELWTRGRVEFPDDYVAVTPEGARWIVDRGLRLVGVDFLSVEARGAEGHPVHTTLLENGVIIVEGLDLSAVEPGPYTFACLPLRIADGDGGPARAMLFEP